MPIHFTHIKMSIWKYMPQKKRNLCALVLEHSYHKYRVQCSQSQITESEYVAWRRAFPLPSSVQLRACHLHVCSSVSPPAALEFSRETEPTGWVCMCAPVRTEAFTVRNSFLRLWNLTNPQTCGGIGVLHP